MGRVKGIELFKKEEVKADNLVPNDNATNIF
jgi:hypothetical protein